MSKHHFRSQPALQRSGGRRPSAVVGFALLAMVGIGAGALVSELGREPVPAAETYPGGPVDEPVTSAAASPPPPAELAPAAPPVASLAPTSDLRLAPPPVVRVKATKPARPVRKAVPKPVAAAGPTLLQPSWEQQHEDYERARAAYDAGERSAGYRWAQQNKIKIARHCGVAAQRTPAFVEGCMNYLATKQTRGPGKPREPETPPQEQG